MGRYRGIIVFLFCVLIASCSPPKDDDECILIDTEDNPDVLPYGFMEIDFNSRQLFPLILNHGNLIGLYGSLYKKQLGDSVTSIIFHPYPGSYKDVTCLSHISTPRIDEHISVDYDGDGTEEVAITYFRHDTLWFRLVSNDCDSLYERDMAVVTDQNNNGDWDGYGHAALTHDLNGDGKNEIIVACVAGYDLYPRELICLDWFNDSILWHYDCVTHPNAKTARVIHPPFCSEPLVLFGDNATNNGAKSGTIDDAHSHLRCLNGDGTLRWMRVAGEEFTSTRPYIIDYNNDGISEVCFPFSHRTENDRLASGLLVCDANGQTIDSIAFASRIHSIFQHDYDSDGRDDLIISLDDGRLIINRQDLSPITKLKYIKPLRILGADDYCGNGEMQFLASGTFGELWLFDSEFKPLALLHDAGKLAILDSESQGFVFLVHRGDNIKRTYFNVLKKNPWYRAFFIKYRIFITGVVGALVASLVVVVFYQRKTKRNLTIIQKQKTELENLHDQLQAAQRQIITDEKYKQAKDIAGGVAHEIHNALCPAVNSLEILDTRLELTGDADLKRNYDLLKLTKAAISRGLQMTELVSAYSKLESEKNLQPINFKQLMEEIVESNRLRLDEMGADVKLNIPGEMEIKCDRTHAFSLFNNLMLNSLDALAEVENRSIDILGRQQLDRTVIRFADTGQGIPEESLARIFDVFYSTKPSMGTGLGLSMVKKIVELYDGTIEVESSVDKGTKFTIIFPKA